MSIFEHIRCINCGCNETEIYATAPDLFCDTTDTMYRMVRCIQCGLIYQNPRPSQADIGQFYPNSYAVHHVSASLGAKLRRNLVNRSKKQIVNEFCTKGSILDVGCATGDFLYEICRNSALKGYGTEISPVASQHAREKYNLNVFQGELTEAQYPANFFDVVTMWSVLEHLHHPIETLAEVRRILRPGGALIVRVPDPDSLGARLFGRYWAGIDLPRHLFLFPRPLLLNTLQSTGFRIHGITYSGYMWSTSISFWYQGKQLHRNRFETYSANLLFWLSRSPLFRIFMAPFLSLINRLEKGDSITVSSQRAD